MADGDATDAPISFVHRSPGAPFHSLPEESHTSDSTTCRIPPVVVAERDEEGDVANEIGLFTAPLLEALSATTNFSLHNTSIKTKNRIQDTVILLLFCRPLRCHASCSVVVGWHPSAANK
jgi:hypothetical protein